VLDVYNLLFLPCCIINVHDALIMPCFTANIVFNEQGAKWNVFFSTKASFLFQKRMFKRLDDALECRQEEKEAPTKSLNTFLFLLLSSFPFPTNYLLVS